MKVMYVYEILNDVGNPVYVGATENPEARIKSHISSSSRGNGKLSKFLRSCEMPVKYRVVAKCTTANISDIEREYIQKRIAEGHDLFNRQKASTCHILQKVDCDITEHGNFYKICLTPKQQERLGDVSRHEIERGKYNDTFVSAILQKNISDQILIYPEASR
jgi:predicted GIY-YIG superfamily endonuclease